LQTILIAGAVTGAFLLLVISLVAGLFAPFAARQAFGRWAIAALSAVVVLSLLVTFLDAGYKYAYCEGNLLKGPVTCPDSFVSGLFDMVFPVVWFVDLRVAPIYPIIWLLWMLIVYG